MITKGLTLEEQIAALTTTELTEEEMALALQKVGLTSNTAINTAATAAETREMERAAAATLEAAAADTTATVTTNGLSAATMGLGNVFKGLWNTLKTNPFVLVIAGLVALVAVIKKKKKRVKAAADKRAFRLSSCQSRVLSELC